MRELDVLRASALLHDVGKLECWAVRKPWSEHVYYTYKFVKECLGEEVAEHAMRHHSSPYYPDHYQPKNHIEEVICLADNIASGADRREETVHGAPLPSPPIELSHILSGETVRNRLKAADLAYISQETLSILKDAGKGFAENPRETYFRVYDALEEKSKLRYVPADTRTPVNDVSLWDHMKLTAAFATCIYLSGWRGFKPESYEFSLLSGDADRISKFISESLRLPDLNARSKLIKDATKNAKNFLKEFLGPECVLFAAGGSILALCPINLVKDAENGVKQSFEKASNNMVSITVSHVETGGDEIRINFGVAWERAQQSLRLKKNRRVPAMSVSLEEGAEACDVCRTRVWSIEDHERILPIDASPRPERLCDVCWSLREKGKGVWLDNIKGETNFVACIKADGDNVGALLSGREFKRVDKACTPSRITALSDIIHRVCELKLTEILGKFGTLASKGIVYAGGDDLLAFVPGEVALEAARDVSSAFREAMAEKCTMSASVAFFHYKLPVYVGVEVAGYLLSKAKNEGRNRIAFAVIGGSGVTRSELDKIKSISWTDLDRLLEIVDFMCSAEAAHTQIRRIAEVSAKNPVKAEAMIQYSMGRGIISWEEGHRLLSYLDSGLLSQSFLIYNLFRRNRHVGGEEIKV